MNKSFTAAVVGLGDVGLPLAVAFGKRFPTIASICRLGRTGGGTRRGCDQAAAGMVLAGWPRRSQ
jgi:hypothetical protein